MEKILIVVDMQNDFVDGSLGTKEAVGIINSVTDKIKGFAGDIFVTLDTHYENYAQTAEGKNLPVPHCIKGTLGWQLNSEVKKALEGRRYTEIEKITFGSVDLPRIIGEKYNTEEIEIELIGLCTDICVISNALLLKANFPEAKISISADCCAGVTVSSHEAALTTMKMCQINVTGEQKNV